MAEPWGHPWVLHTQGALSDPLQARQELPKHSGSFCIHWTRSSLAGCQLPSHGVSPPVPPGECEPSPEHWGFVQGGGAEWRVCAAGQGGKARAACLICLPGNGDRGQARLQALPCQS